MAVERSPERRRRDAKRRARARNAQTWGGPVTVRKVEPAQTDDPTAEDGTRS